VTTISTTYQELVGTSFPDSIDTYEKLSDITLDTLQYALQYSSLYNQGKLSEAYALLEQYPALKRCIINADKINKLIDSIKALQTYSLDLNSSLSDTQDTVSVIDTTVNNLNTSVSSLTTNVTNINTTVNTINTKVEAIEEFGTTITKETLGLENVDNTSDANKSVKYATSSGTAAACTGNSATATNADKVDGFDITISTTDLVAGSSALATNTFCFVYE